MAKYTYALEVRYKEEWTAIGGASDIPLNWGLGYLCAQRDGPSPSCAMRVVRSDGKVMGENNERTEVNIGMVAGWPTAEQYEAAAERALMRARKIREGAHP